MMTTKKHLLTGAALLGASALALTGCAGNSTDAAGSSDAAGDRPIVMPVVEGWDEGIAVSELWKAVLEEQGYEVELEYADVATIFTGISQGDYDVYMDAWLPLTHEQYMDEYGDDVVDLGAWNDEASLTIAVNEDAPIDSLSELAENADLFDNEIIGIEAGSGLVTITQDAVIPGYGLEDMDFIVSSTPAMLTELQSATDAGENIAVTLWRPHWAYSAFPIKDLEDPEGLLGDAEGMHTITSTGFGDEFGEVNGWLENFEMPSDVLYDLENVMFNENDSDDYAPVVADWIAENQEWVDSLTS